MPPLTSQLVTRRFIIWSVLASALGALCCFAPLVSRLGYEVSFVFALFGSFAAAHLGATSVSTTREAAESMLLCTRQPADIVMRLCWRAVSLAWLVLLSPLLLLTLNVLRVRNCDYMAGLGFFLALPAISAAIAACTGVIAGLVARRRITASLLGLSIVLASLLWGIYRFYAHPPIFAYDPFAGYFAGTIYDEDVTPRWPFIYARLQQFFWLFSGLTLATGFLDSGSLRCKMSSRRLRPLLLALPLLTAAVLMTRYSGQLGFALDANDIKRELGGVVYTRHFEIIYPRDFDDKTVALLVEDHEFRYAQLAQTFSLAPDQSLRIRSFIFANAEQKRRLMGAARVYIAKPWLKDVYLQHAAFPHPVLKHELAHVFGVLHGDNTFGISLAWRPSAIGVPYPHFNVGLIEGLAVAVDWRAFGEITNHQRAAALFRLELAPPIEQLFGVGFLAHASGRAYGLAGSFCRYLLDRYGFKKLATVYRKAGRFESVYRKSLAQLVSEWRRFIETVPVSKQQLALVKARLRRPSILRRPCPHVVANLRADVRDLLAKGKERLAIATMEKVCRYEPENPYHMIALMDLRARVDGPLAGLALEKQVLAHRALGTPEKRHVLELAGDLYWSSKKPAASQKAYDEAAKYPASAAGRRLLALKRWALRSQEPLRTTTMSYLVRSPGEQRNPAQQVHIAHRIGEILAALDRPGGWGRPKPGLPGDWGRPKPDLPSETKDAKQDGIGLYLQAKQLAGRGFCDLAIPRLEKALARSLLSRDFVVEANRELLRCRYLRRDLAGAKRTLSALQRLAPTESGLTLYHDDWAARVSWRQSGHLPPSKSYSSPPNLSARSSRSVRPFRSSSER
jgi:hypothetical protein